MIIFPIRDQYTGILNTQDNVWLGYPDIENTYEDDLVPAENMNVDGSAQSVKYYIGKGEFLKIRGIRIVIGHNEWMKDEKFGGINKLNRGILLRLCDENSNKVIINAKSNNDLIESAKNYMYDFNEITREHLFSADFEIPEYGPDAIKLNNESYIEIFIQDNLTMLSRLKMYFYCDEI